MRIGDWSSDVCSSDLTFRLRDPSIDGSHQLQDRVLADGVVATFEGSESRTRDDRNIVAVEVALRKFFADFEFDELEQFGIVELVDLVEEDDHGRNAEIGRAHV